MAKLQSKIFIIVAFVALFWGLEGVDFVTHHQLDQWGALHPRTQIGLAQIFTSPFLHGGWGHLASNTLGFIPLSALVLLQGGFWSVMLISMIVGGLGTWLFSVHPALGFSGVLFGFMGFLLTRGLITRKPLALVISLLSFSWFSGSLWIGLIPQAGISWAGHFWGFVGGVVAARFVKIDK